MEIPNIETKKSREEIMLLENEMAELKENLRRVGSEKGRGRRSDDQKVEDNQERRGIRARIKEIEGIIKKQSPEELVKEDEIFDKGRQPEEPEEIKTEPKPTTEPVPDLNAQGQKAQEPKPEKRKEKVIIPQESKDLFAGELKDEDKENIINKTLEIIREKNGYDLQLKLDDKSEYLTDAIDSYLIDKDNLLVNVKTIKGKDFIVDFNRDDAFSVMESERIDDRFVVNLYKEFSDKYGERGDLIDQKKFANNKEEIDELNQKLQGINSKINYLYEKIVGLGMKGLDDREKERVESIGKIIEREKSKRMDRSAEFMSGMESADLVDDKIEKQDGFRSEAEVSAPENQTEVKESFETRATKIKKELFENAGNKSKEELIQLISDVEKILDEEKEKGKGKLKDKISETRDSEFGKEKFTDDSIVYLPKDGEAVFIGDTHGDPDATVSIIEQEKFIEAMENGEKNKYLVFLGDYADRGSGDIENLEQIFALKKKYPDNVILMRGNHEEKDTGSRYGLSNSLANKYKEGGQELFDKYNKAFEKMPGVLVCGNGIVATHGGIPSKEISSLKELNNEELLFQMRWNDPKGEIEDWAPNLDRDSSDSMGIKVFGKNAFDKFMKAIDGKIMIRGHEYGGVKLFFDNRLVTVFSTGGGGEKSGYEGNARPLYTKFDLGKDINKIIGNEKGNEVKRVSYVKPDYEIKEPAPENQGGKTYEMDDEQFENVKLFLGKGGEGRWNNALFTLWLKIEDDFKLPDYFSGMKGFNVYKKNENSVEILLILKDKKVSLTLDFDNENKNISVSAEEEIKEESHKISTLEKVPEIKEREELAKMAKHELNREIVMTDEWLKKMGSKETTIDEKVKIKEKEDYLELLVEMKELSKAPESVREAIQTLKETEGRLHKVLANIPDEDKMLAIDYNKGERLSPEEVEIAKGVNTLQELKTTVSIDTLSAMIAKSRYMSFEEGRKMRRAVLEEMTFLKDAEERALFHAEKNLNEMVARKEIEPMRMAAVNRFAGAITKTRAIETPTTPPASPEEGEQEGQKKSRVSSILNRIFGVKKSTPEQKEAEKINKKIGVEESRIKWFEKENGEKAKELEKKEGELKKAEGSGEKNKIEKVKTKIQEIKTKMAENDKEIEKSKEELIKLRAGENLANVEQEEEISIESLNKQIENSKEIADLQNVFDVLLKVELVKDKDKKEFEEMVINKLNDGSEENLKDVINHSNKEIGVIGQSNKSPEKKAALVKFYKKVIEIAEGMERGGGDAGKPKVEKPEPKVSQNKKPELKKERENERILDKYNLSDAYEIVKKMDENEIKKEWRAHPKLKIETSNKPVIIDEEVIKDYNEMVVKKAIETGDEIPFYFVIDNEKNRVVDMLMGEGFSSGRVGWDLFSAKYKEGIMWRDAHERRKNTENYNKDKYTVIFGHTHPAGYGPIFSHVKGPGNFGADYSATMSSKDTYYGDHLVCNFHIVGSPDMNLIGAIETKEKGEIVYHPINVLAEEKAKEEKMEPKEISEADRKKIENILNDNEISRVNDAKNWDELIGVIENRKIEASAKLNNPVIAKLHEMLEFYLKKFDLNKRRFDKISSDANQTRLIEFEKNNPEIISNENVKKFLGEVYYKISTLLAKEIGDKKGPDKKPPEQDGGEKGKEREKDGWNERRENLIENVKKYISKNLNQDEKKFFFEIAETEFEYRPFSIFIEDMIKDKKMDKLSELRKYYKNADDLKLTVVDLIKEENLSKKTPEPLRLREDIHNELSESLSKMKAEEIKSLYDNIITKMEKGSTIEVEAEKLSKTYGKDVKKIITDNFIDFEKIKNLRVGDIESIIYAIYNIKKQKEEKAKKKEQSASRSEVKV